MAAPGEPTPTRAAGAVLAGGRSRRLGTDKAAVEVAGSTLVARTGAVLRAAGLDPVVTVGGPPRGEPFDGHLDDPDPGAGPLGGVVAALEALADRAAVVVVVACDLPHLSPATVRRLVAALTPDLDAVAVLGPRGPEPLLVAWGSGLAPVARAAYDAGERAPRAVLGVVRSVTIEAASPEELHDVDTPADLDRSRRIAASPDSGTQWGT